MAKEKQPKVEQDQEVNDAQMKTEAEAKAIIEKTSASTRKDARFRQTRSNQSEQADSKGCPM